MVRRIVVLIALIAGSGLTAVAVSGTADAGPGVTFTSSNITTPTDGTHYIVSTAHPITNVPVTGTVSPPTPGATVDINCYGAKGDIQTGPFNVPLDVTGTTFSTTMSTNTGYAGCVLKAVPHLLLLSDPATAFTGPRLVFEYDTRSRIGFGPNTGRLYDFETAYVFGQALADFSSVFDGGYWDARMQYPNGRASNYLWLSSGALQTDLASGRSPLRVDGRNAYGPFSAETAFVNSEDNPGFPKLTITVSRNKTADTATIHESDPIVVCPTNTFPPTAASCPRFKSAGVRLERTIVIRDHGLQVRISDVWRSTDHKAHTISPQYRQRVEGLDFSSGTSVPVEAGIKLPWISNSYTAFTSEHVYPGPGSGPVSIFVHDNNLAADGDKDFPRGAVTFDIAPKSVRRISNGGFITTLPSLKVPADGKRLVRMFYVMGTKQSVVNAKAAANKQRLR